MSLGITISLTAYFLLMIGIGIYAWRKSTSNSEEYLLGGRQLSPGVAALSAGASDMSGWLLMGLPGALFVSGLTQSWIGIGLVVARHRPRGGATDLIRGCFGITTRTHGRPGGAARAGVCAP